MEKCNVEDWVNLADNPSEKSLREAIHTVLYAISISTSLRYEMVMKGGVLLAIRWNSVRFTQDIDFSTYRKYDDFDRDNFLKELGATLVQAVEHLDYGLDCKIQSLKVQPSNIDSPTFPTIKLTIGYAYKHDQNAHKRLLKNNASSVLKIDYSLNEETYEIENLEIDDGLEIKAYSIIDLISEKLRAIVQQKERNRVRRQDSYDIYLLLQQINLRSSEKRQVLESYIKKSESRNIHVSKDSLSDQEVIERSQREYSQLQKEIIGELPPFEKVYTAVEEFYKTLPWEEFN